MFKAGRARPGRGAAACAGHHVDEEKGHAEISAQTSTPSGSPSHTAENGFAPSGYFTQRLLKVAGSSSEVGGGVIGGDSMLAVCDERNGGAHDAGG